MKKGGRTFLSKSYSDGQSAVRPAQVHHQTRVLDEGGFSGNEKAILFMGEVHRKLASAAKERLDV